MHLKTSTNTVLHNEIYQDKYLPVIRIVSVVGPAVFRPSETEIDISYPVMDSLLIERVNDTSPAIGLKSIRHQRDT